MSIRPVKRIVQAQATLEGAGVHLRRAFGFGNTEELDPFLLLDDFRNDEPERYRQGFPWHPHRGIETITYVLAGTVDHADSLGNAGAIGPGDVQWMTAGSGIIHQEMPHGDEAGRMHGFQLWANLPAEHKMTTPRYQGILAGDVPEVTDDDGTAMRVICGDVWGVSGPVDGIAADPQYVDIWVPPLKKKRIPIETSRSAFAYVFAGSGRFANASDPVAAPTETLDENLTETIVPAAAAENRTLVMFDRGDEVVVTAGEEGIRFLLVSGQPLREPVSWYGPIVMNTRAEIQRALAELNDGSFIKHRG
ncbi:MAG: pirin family protein [Gemmatimonadales bacterium]